MNNKYFFLLFLFTTSLFAKDIGTVYKVQLYKAGVKSIVLEKDQTLGGLSRTINYKNYYFDI